MNFDFNNSHIKVIANAMDRYEHLVKDQRELVDRMMNSKTWGYFKVNPQGLEYSWSHNSFSKPKSKASKMLDAAYEPHRYTCGMSINEFRHWVKAHRFYNHFLRKETRFRMINGKLNLQLVVIRSKNDD